MSQQLKSDTDVEHLSESDEKQLLWGFYINEAGCRRPLRSLKSSQEQSQQIGGSILASRKLINQIYPQAHSDQTHVDFYLVKYEYLPHLNKYKSRERRDLNLNFTNKQKYFLFQVCTLITGSDNEFRFY